MPSRNKVILEAVLDTLSFAVFVLEEDRKVAYANRAAAALLEGGGPFHIDQSGALRIAESGDDKALREAVAASRRAPEAARRRVIPVHARADRPAMFAWLSPLEVAEAPGRVSVMVTRRGVSAVGREVLGELFGLTLAESRLVQGLLQGMSPGQYAARQALSQNTVRNQLKSIFEKTEVRRQSDLVSLICNVLAPVDFDRPAGDGRAPRADAGRPGL